MEFILDTNIIINLIKDKTDAEILKLANKILSVNYKKNYQIPFPIPVAMELISHLDDENISKRNTWQNALEFLVKITRLNLDEEIEFIPPYNTILGCYFFNKEEDFLNNYVNVIKFSKLLSMNKILNDIENENELKVNLELTKAIRQSITNEKSEIKTNIESFLSVSNKGIIDWELFKKDNKKRDKLNSYLKSEKAKIEVARSYFIRAHQLNNLTYTIPKNETEILEKFNKDFSPAIQMMFFLFNQVAQGLITFNNIDDKKWNTLIDISIIFGFLFNPLKKDRIFVTEEKKIIEFFNNSTHKGKANKLSDFLRHYE